MDARDIEKEKMEANSPILLWRLMHNSPEDKQLIANFEKLLHLTEMAAYREGLNDANRIAEPA